MICQLKILLKKTKPPLWIRILVQKNMTFADLHEVIQNHFGWEGLFLYGFEPKKSGGEILNSFPYSIGPTEFGDEIFTLRRYEFHDQEEMLSRWLVCEKDKVVYVYNYREDLRHEIVLEKILEHDSRLQYPHCLKTTLDYPLESELPL